MKVFIGMECSGVVRRAFRELGHQVVSADFKEAEDGVDASDVYHGYGHLQMDVFEALDYLARDDWYPAIGIFHPECTYLTCSAEWAYGDGPYHQKVKPETLVGELRRQARREAVALCKRIMGLNIPSIAMENPRGHLSSAYRKPNQTIQPYMFGDDASKATCLWTKNLPNLVATNFVHPRIVNGKKRWGNQTDSGQNKLSPSKNRASDRARTYQGIANAFALQWGGLA